MEREETTAETRGAPTAAWVQETKVQDLPGALRRFAARPYCLFLDSAKQHPTLGRYSFLMADPIHWVIAKIPDHDPLTEIQSKLDAYRADTLPELPPFQGGAAGLLGYELGRCYENVAAASVDEFQVPIFAVGIYDVVLAIDHVQQRSWIISQGFPETDLAARRERAEARGREVLSWLNDPAVVAPERSRLVQLGIEQLAPQYRVDSMEGLTSDFSRQHYLEFVRRAVEYIHAGDIFQVNLSQRFLYPAAAASGAQQAADNSLELYLRLRDRNAGTFAGYFDIGDTQILSASPERFVSVRDQVVETRPIKGTRRRMDRPEADLYSAKDLHESQKDRAENVMIVDLLRNDLSRACLPESVRVTQLCELEQYEFVQHLVSAVQGTLKPECHPLDLIRAAFPGGSITGAPKVRAMEIIAELEPTVRGPYCGSLGYIGFDQSMDLSILIRTITASRGWLQMPAGGGIVAASQPQAEYQETLDKARGMIRSL